ncbi:MAG: Ig-like domain-containing protein, partial [Bryobacteraceae bacterium]|nr:Ig-like domain-containing protein [Bryobacteraceae bacterium]
GSVNHTPAQTGNGVYFQACCGNTNNAYYKFTGAAVGSVFNVNQGQISFYLKSRYSFAQRPSGARFAFDVRDNDPNNHLFFFHTLKTSGQLLLTYSVGGGAQFYYVPAGTEEAKFGNGVTMKVTIAWTGSQSRLFLNDALVQTSSYVKPTPNWTAASNFNLGAYEYLSFGGYNSLDDVIDEFTVSALPSGQDTTPPAVSISAPTGGAALTGTGITVSANATDNTAMASVQFKLDGTNLGNAVTGAGPLYSIAWNTTTAANGPHILTAIATDAAGNSAASAPINVTVNNPQPPVISGVSANPVTTSTATITWTTDKPSDSRVAYGLTSAYGSLTPLDTAMVTSHSIVISGLSPSTTYHYQVISKDAQGITGVSGNLTFTTGGAAGGGGGTLMIKGDATEVSGTTNGSLVTPNLAPSGFTGTVVSKGSGTVNYAAAQTGNGVYFQNCCGNTNNAYYKFAGAAVGSVFNINQGQISFYLKSRYSFAQRPSGARFAFDVRDNDPNNHLFYFHTLKTSGQLLLTYSVGGGAQFYYIPAGTEEAKFGNGVAIKVTITWNGAQSQLYLNDVLVQTASYVKPTPNWTAASNFNLGAYEYLNLGGYNGLDDIIDEFTVSAPSN